MKSVELTRLLAAERASRPGVGELERGLPRLLSSVAAELGPAAGAAMTTSHLLGGVGKLVLAGFAVGVAASAVVASSFSTTPADPVASVAAPPQTSLAQGASVAAAEPPPVAAAPSPSARPLTASRATPLPSAAGDRPPITFDAELRLIELAKSELDAGRPQGALGWLAEHERRFPSGVFATERDALRVRARCARSPEPELARAFAAARPGSPLTARLIRECAPRAEAIDK